MKDDKIIDELLNGFVDGELTEREKIEVKRLAANDPEILQRIERIRKCRMLVASIPSAEAPGHLLENVKASIRKTNRYIPNENKTILLRSQRILAVAATIGIVAVLAVVFTLLSKEPVLDGLDSGLMAKAGFGGRLELKADEFIEFNAIVRKTIEEYGLDESLNLSREQNRSVYSIVCSRRSLNLLLTELDRDWNKVDSATLLVDSDVFGEPIVVNNVGASQILDIAEKSTKAEVIQTAREYATLNNLNNQLPGREILTAIETSMADIISISKPFLTSNDRTASEFTEEPQSEKTIDFTIVVSR